MMNVKDLIDLLKQVDDEASVFFNDKPITGFKWDLQPENDTNFVDLYSEE